MVQVAGTTTESSRCSDIIYDDFLSKDYPHDQDKSLALHHNTNTNPVDFYDPFFFDDDNDDNIIDNNNNDQSPLFFYDIDKDDLLSFIINLSYRL